MSKIFHRSRKWVKKEVKKGQESYHRSKRRSKWVKKDVLTSGTTSPYATCYNLGSLTAGISRYFNRDAREALALSLCA